MTATLMLFSGQGGQVPYLTASDIKSYPIMAATFAEASSCLAMDMVTLWTDDHYREQLLQTQWAQPAIVTLSVALYRTWCTKHQPPAWLMGLSLGEYSALIASGALSLSAGLKLIQQRGQLMQAACNEHPGVMAAVLTANSDQVEQLCVTAQRAGYQVSLANYNSSKQVVIGGTAAGVAVVQDQLKAAGQRTIPLKVSGAFHTDLMAEANDLFAHVVDQTKWHPLTTPVISNTTGQPFTDKTLVPTLKKQMVTATHFAQGLAWASQQGADQVVEVGPTRSLVKFAQQTNRQWNCTSFRVPHEDC